MRRADWNLLALSAAGGKPLSPVQYQKVLFLLGKAFPSLVEGAYYRFEPYNYGAFDPTVYRDGEVLEREGLARITRPGSGWHEYAATPAGVRRAAQLEEQLPSTVTEYIRQLVMWARGLSFRDLVRAVYRAYPETKANSIFTD